MGLTASASACCCSGTPTRTTTWTSSISGKPDWSLPANIPVAFELTSLFSAFTAFFGMLGLNKLPHLSNPLYKQPSVSPRDRDRFAICVEAKDPNFDAGRDRAILGSGLATTVEDCPADTSRAALPFWFHAVARRSRRLRDLHPAGLAVKGRFATSEKPRYHVWPDMDWQRKRKTQTEWEMFPDGRAMRLPVEGTIARGELRDDFELYFGVDQDRPRSRDRVSYEAGTPWARTHKVTGLARQPDRDGRGRGAPRTRP